MDIDEIELKCFAVLDQDLPEEEKIEAVEALVRDSSKDVDEPTLERLILDILWAHRQGKKVKKPKIVNQTASKTIKVPAKPKKKYVSLDEIDIAEPTPPAEESPYDMLLRLFGEHNTAEDIDRLLTHNEFNIGRTVDMLLNSSTVQDPEVLLTDQTAQRVVCKYFLAGNCMRGDDCMYSHDMSSKICRFWLQGRCLAGSNCAFLHSVPSQVVDKLKPSQPVAQKAPVQHTNLPSLKNLPALGAKKKSKPAPQQQQQQPSNTGGYDLSAINAALPKRDTTVLVNRGKVPIRYPLRTPWEHPEYGPNAEYLELRAQAKKHSDARNKYLQMATDSWASNDPASAKLLSKKGQIFNQSMVEVYRKGADLLWKHSAVSGSEIFIDLHGLELGAAIDHMEAMLIEVEQSQEHAPRVAYIISGRGHYKIKRHADQLTQHVKAYLDRYGYLHKDFSESPYGRLIGVDPWSSIVL